MNALPMTKEFLNEKFKERKQRNSSYSLRTFAKSLNLSPSGLSRILSGDVKLSAARANEVAECLKMPQLERELFLLLLEAETETDPVRQKEIFEKAYFRIDTLRRQKDKLDSLPQFISMESIIFISVLKAGIQPKSSRELANLLKTTVSATEEMVSTMKLQDWISGNWGDFKLVKPSILISFLSQPLQGKKIYQRLFEMASVHLERSPKEERAIGFESFALDEKLLPDLRKLTYHYLDQVSELASKSVDPNLIVQTVAAAFVSSRIDNKGEIK